MHFVEDVFLTITTETSAGKYWDYKSGSQRESENEEHRGEFLSSLSVFFSFFVHILFKKAYKGAVLTYSV